MRIATWNVNSVRARMPRLLPWLEQRDPDVVLLQETKCLDQAFPREELEDAGYRVESFGQKTYNGVAILSKRPIEDVIRGLPDDAEDAERRVIAATVEDVMFVNVYVVNGKSVGTEAYAYKLAWMERLGAFLADYCVEGERVVVGGDFNVTFDDRDVHDPLAWDERILCSTPERNALFELCERGKLVDAMREFDPNPGIHTWWDFRTRAFDKNRGLRIDHFLMSQPAIDACRLVDVDLEARAGEKPSDHAPLLAELD